MTKGKQHFDALVEQWRRETSVLSNPHKIVEHHCYREIVQMGWTAVQWIVADLTTVETGGEPYFWGPALREITGHVIAVMAPEHAGRPDVVAAGWLALARENGWDKPSYRRGFAGLTPERRREVCSKGGLAAHAQGVAHEFTKDEARAAGKKGGDAVSQNRRHMAEIGRRGGERVSQDRAHMAEIGRKGGSVVSDRPGHMRSIGQRGGEAKRKS